MMSAYVVAILEKIQEVKNSRFGYEQCMYNKTDKVILDFCKGLIN